MRFIALLLLLPISIFGQDLTLVISSQEAPSCGGGNDGIIVLLADGGVSPYVYSIVGGDEQDSSTFEGLEAGDYEFSVTDADGTIVFVSGALEDGINLSLNINDIDPTCMEASDGQLMIIEVNGVSDVTYEISGPAEDSNMTGIFTNLPIGTYIVSVSTSSNCIIVISTILSSDVECPEELSLTTSSQITPTCAGVTDGVIVLMASGGVSPYTYSIDGGDQQDNNTFEGLGAGDYELSATDTEGSTVLISITLENEINLSIDINEIDPSCTDATDGQLVVSEESGVSNVTFEISGPTSASNMTGIFTDLPIGTYVVTITSNSQCSVEISATLTSNVDCPEEDPNVCPILVNRIGMQINKVGENEYSLRVHYKDEVDVIKYVSYTALYDIIDFHLMQRQINVSLNSDFKFSSFCSDIEAMRNENNVNANTSQATLSTQYEIDLIRGFVLDIKEGESLKI